MRLFWAHLGVALLLVCFPRMPVSIAIGGGGKVADESTRLRVVLFLATNDATIGPSVEKDEKKLDAFFAEAFARHPDRLGPITKVAGKNLTIKKVLETLNELPSAANESLLVYFCCHGGVVKGNHVFDLDDDSGKAAYLPRAKVLSVMLSKQPRLALLLSDSCGNYLLPGEKERADDPPDWEVVRSLFLKPQGVVDINSASEGESAFGMDIFGGFFTHSLVVHWRSKMGALQPSAKDQVFWHDLVPSVQAKTQFYYGARRARQLQKLTDQFLTTLSKEERKDAESMREALLKQESQTVRVFQMPPQWRFGARVLDNDGAGVKVGFVHAGTPAAAAGLKAGDVIRKAGAKSIQSLPQFFEAVFAGTGKIELTVIRNDKTIKLQVDLGPEAGVSQDI